MRHRIFILAAFAALALAGCEDGDAGSSDGGASSGTCQFADIAPADGEVADGAVCGDIAVDAYAVGLARVGDAGLVRLRFVAASQSPPDVGLNRWDVEVVDADCQPVDGASIEARPYMNQHHHGTVPELHASVAGESTGAYTIGPVDLPMAGWWEVTFTVTLDDGSVDTVVFDFCLEG